MNARITPVEYRKDLNEFQRNEIIRTATSKRDPYMVRAEKLRKITYATDECKFELLEARIEKDLYNTLYALYFGEAQPDQEGEDAAENAANAAEMQQKKTERRSYTIWDEADVMTLIHYYNKGASAKELAAMFNRSTQQIRDKLKALKKDDKYREMFNMDNGQDKKFEEIINSVDEGRRLPELPDDEPEPFIAEGFGLISTDGSIKLDDEPILAALRKAIVDSGSVQFYGTVQIIITPHKPTGMKVTRGAR